MKSKRERREEKEGQEKEARDGDGGEERRKREGKGARENWGNERNRQIKREGEKSKKEKMN